MFVSLHLTQLIVEEQKGDYLLLFLSFQPSAAKHVLVCLQSPREQIKVSI